MRFLVRLIFTAAALWVAVRLLEGITYEGSWAGLLIVALVFGLVNAIIRPILYFLTCPFIVATLGLLVFVINAVLLLLTAAFARSLGIDFRVESFVDALVGAIIIGVVSAVLSVFVPDEDRRHARDR